MGKCLDLCEDRCSCVCLYYYILCGLYFDARCLPLREKMVSLCQKAMQLPTMVSDYIKKICLRVGSREDHFVLVDAN